MRTFGAFEQVLMFLLRMRFTGFFRRRRLNYFLRDASESFLHDMGYVQKI